MSQREQRRRVQVGGYTRRVNGRRQQVGGYSYRLQPRRAWGNTRRAYRSVKRKRHSDAVVYGSLAVAEIGAWTAMRGTALALTTIGLLAIALGVTVRRMTQ